jgi:hypothetical protein
MNVSYRIPVKESTYKKNIEVISMWLGVAALLFLIFVKNSTARVITSLLSGFGATYLLVVVRNWGGDATQPVSLVRATHPESSPQMSTVQLKKTAIFDKSKYQTAIVKRLMQGGKV